jgi:hypothetical protein
MASGLRRSPRPPASTIAVESEARNLEISIGDLNERGDVLKVGDLRATVASWLMAIRCMRRTKVSSAGE